MKEGLQYILILAVSFISIVLGSGYSYHTKYTPAELSEVGERIYGDGWIEDKAILNFNELLPFGNRIILHSADWHPPGLAGSELEILVCGEQRARILVEPSSKYQISLRGSCEPRQVQFNFKNPFVPSDQDQRNLGAKIVAAEISSKVGIPLVSLPLILTLTIPVIILSLVTFKLTENCYAILASVAVSVLASLLIAMQSELDLSKIIWIYFVAGALTVGALASKKIPEDNEKEKDLLSTYSRFSLFLVLLIAIVFRLWGLDFGLPENFHPDEVPKFNAIMRMYSEGTLNPRYFLHPSLLLYSTYALAYLLHVIGIFTDFSQGIIISGRIVSASAGVISVWFVYAIANKLFNNKVAIWSALILAVSPLHITCSRYVKEDALLTCMVLASVYWTARAVKEDRKRLLLWGGFFAGLSASVKYSGLLSVGIVASAPWLVSGHILPARSWINITILSLLLFPLGFLIATPYSLLDLQKFIKDSSYEQRHMEKGHTTTIDAWSQYWVYYLSRCIIPGLTWPIVLVAGIATGAALWLRKISLLWIAYLVLVFYLPSEYVKSKPAPQPDRYIMPCLPFLAILAGWGFKRFFSFAGGIFIIAVICLFPIKRSYQLASDLSPDTRVRMRDWIMQNIPKGETILIDWPVYSPNLSPEHYKIEYIERSRILEVLEPRRLRQSGYRYLLLSSFFYGRYFTQPNVEPTPRERVRNVFRRFPIIHEERAASGSYGFHNPNITLLEISDATNSEISEMK